MKLATGSRLGQYEIVAPLGSGGMGEVYRARDTKLERAVALKLLPPDLAADPQFRQRFEREARAVAALNHPNIVTIYSVEQDGDALFLTMELVEGKTLSDVVPKGGLSVDRLLRLAIPLADAVSAAHERGITHRDLKPANLMVTADGRVKVLDFGLAKLRDEGSRTDGVTTLPTQELTGEGRILGTVAYMSPEQAEGKPIDHRSDIFSLGVLLYELATGERPFKGDTSVSVISSIIKDTPPSVIDLNASLPRDLGRIVKRALVKDPEHRYQTAKDLRNDLETLKEELDSGAGRPAVVEARPAAGGGRSKMLGAAAALGAVIVVGAGAAWYVASRTEAPAPAAAPPAFQNIKLTRLTNSGKATLAAVSPDARYVVHVVDEGRQSLWVRQVATASNVQIVPPDDVRYDGVTFSPDGNYVYYGVYPASGSFSTVYQVPVLGGAPRKIIEDVDTPLAFSPDGRQIAFVRGVQSLGESVLIVAGADGTGERRLAVSKVPLAFALNNVAWSPDGSKLALAAAVDVTRQMTVVIVDVATGRETSVGEKPWGYIGAVAWMADGRGLVVAAAAAAAGSSPQIWHISYPQGEARRITNDLNNYWLVSLSADAKTLVAVQDDQLAHLWVGPASDATRAVRITSGTGRLDGVSGLAWTPDGRIVFASTASGNPDIWIADAAGGNQRQLTVDPGLDLVPSPTPDGRSIVFFSNRTGPEVWLMDVDGSNQRPLTSNVGAGFPVVSPDSKWAYYASFLTATRRIWRVPIGGGTPERLAARWEQLGIVDEDVFYHPTLIPLAISPDGTMLAGGYSDPDRRGYRIGLFPIAGGQPRRLEIPSPIMRWTPDGRSLAYVDRRGGVSHLVLQPVAGGAARPVASFSGDIVFEFALSPDGRQIALSRGTVTSDVVLITNVDTQAR